MRPARTLGLVPLILVLFPSIVASQPPLTEADSADSKVPLLIRQGPLFQRQQPTSDYYWYQVGAIGTSSSYDFTGANLTIRTVYDQVNDDAHSYWVGAFLSNDAFIQVGYLNGLSTTGQSYCCAWFYEYFPAGQVLAPGEQKCCLPVIGREGSAGGIGSWHTYSMVHTTGGVWSFYMDGDFLGSTPPLGATNSGENAPAGIAEVAQATSSNDVLGPAEFKYMWFRPSAGDWQRVSAADNLITYGEDSLTLDPNPYGARAVTGVVNDFLAGSYIPQLASPSPNPGPSLWDISAPQLPPNQFSLFFVDAGQVPFEPEWVSLRSTGGSSVFYTDSQDYFNLRIWDGTWTVDRVMWHAVNVAQGGSVMVSGPSSLTVRTTVSTLRVRVIGSLFGLPVGGATLVTFLPDTANATAETDSSGIAVLRLLPPSTYYLRITVPYGIPGISSHAVPAVGEVTSRVIGLAEMLSIIIAPISIAVLATILAVRRERLRIASMPTIPSSVIIVSNCPNCGTPLHVSDLFCPNCRAPVRPQSQPPPSQPAQNPE